MLRFWTSLAFMCATLFTYSASSYADSAVAPADDVIQWNKTLLAIVRTPGAQPATVHPTRSFAIQITQTAVQAHHLTTAQSARTFALLNLTLADEVIAFYDTKYTYNFWRPVTAIRAAAVDGNPDTTADPNWLPQAGKTAADPAYPGAHATISAGGAFVLKALFGDKPYQLNVTSEVLPGVVRSFDSFAAVEKEASLSRIYAGQHFRSDENAGQRLGSAVADFIVDNFLTPVHRRNEGDRDGDGY